MGSGSWSSLFSGICPQNECEWPDKNYQKLEINPIELWSLISSTHFAPRSSPSAANAWEFLRLVPDMAVQQFLQTVRIQIGMSEIVIRQGSASVLWRFIRLCKGIFGVSSVSAKSLISVYIGGSWQENKLKYWESWMMSEHCRNVSESKWRELGLSQCVIFLQKQSSLQRVTGT